MKILRNFSIFYGEDQDMLDDLASSEISQRKLSNFSENDFRKVRKQSENIWKKRKVKGQ